MKPVRKVTHPEGYLSISDADGTFFQWTFYVSSFSCFTSRHSSLEGKPCWSAAGGVSKATILFQSPLLWMIVSCSYCTSSPSCAAKGGEGNQTKPNPQISSFWFFCFFSWFIFWMQNLIHPRCNANLLFIVIGELYLKKKKYNWNMLFFLITDVNGLSVR